MRTAAASVKPTRRRSKRHQAASASDSSTPASSSSPRQSAPPPPYLSADEVALRTQRNANRSFVGARIFNWDNIVVLGQNEHIRAHFNRIGWGAFLNMSFPVHKLLSLEFFSSFSYDASRSLGDNHAVVFTLGGRRFNLSINDLNVLLGFESDESLMSNEYTSAHCDLPDSFGTHVHECWRELSIDAEYVPKAAQSNHLRDGALRLCHRFLSCTFFGRLDMMNVVTQQEVFILDCMILGEKLNFGAWLARQWQFTAKHHLYKVSLGHMITLLAQRLHVPYDEPEALPASYFSIPDFTAMRLLCVNAEGQYQLSQLGVEDPSSLSVAGSSATPSALMPAFEKMLTTVTRGLEERLARRLDDIDERITAIEHVLRNMTR